MLSIQAVRGLPRLRAPGMVPCFLQATPFTQRYKIHVAIFEVRSDILCFTTNGSKNNTQRINNKINKVRKKQTKLGLINPN